MPSKIRGLASAEIGLIAEELQTLVGSFFKNFYEIRQNCFLVTFSKERKESAVYISLARTINLTEFKERGEAPTDFALNVRKRLDGSRVESVEQHESDRILVVAFSGKEKMKMIAEMFAKGNLLLVNEQNLIELVYSGASFSERSLGKRMLYKFPLQRGKTEKRTGIGASPRIYEKNGEYLDFAAAPVDKYEHDTGITLKRFDSMSKLLDTLYLDERATEVSPEKAREAEELRKSIDKLRKQVEEMQVKGEEYKRIANKIFERMDEINALISHAGKSKVRDPSELKGLGNINVKSVDPKRKTMTIELD